jgi:HPr kinase/phosphorylase
MVDTAERTSTPLLLTSLLSPAFIRQMEAFLENMLILTTSIHGVLVDVFGVGLLILGTSGIGKSEIAVDLVMRGHRLVADDIVEVQRKGADSVLGSSSPIIRHHMEIRGLGIINIKDLFGVSAVRDAKKIEMVVELVDWDPHEDYDRLGVEERKFRVLDVEVPLVMLPVRPGRSMTAIIEVAARNHLLKLQGHYSAKEFQDRLNREIADSANRRAVGDEVE